MDRNLGRGLDADPHFVALDADDGQRDQPVADHDLLIHFP
jgi:hypothetical protein